MYTPQIETTEFVVIGKTSSMGKRLCLHPVKNEKIGAEVSFTKEAAKKMFSIFSDYQFEKKEFEGIIPSDIVYAKDSITKGVELVWIIKKHTASLSYSTDCQKTGLLSKEYLLPTLIFKYSKKTLSVFSLIDNSAGVVNSDTELYHAPFYNVNKSGQVCMGNVNIGKVEKFKTFDKCKEYLESSFFYSYFTHSNSELITKEYLLSLESVKSFNNQNLKKTDFNLASILK